MLTDGLAELLLDFDEEVDELQALKKGSIKTRKIPLSKIRRLLLILSIRSSSPEMTAAISVADLFVFLYFLVNVFFIRIFYLFLIDLSIKKSEFLKMFIFYKKMEFVDKQHSISSITCKLV
jgi:hypothetical protein